MFVEGYGSRLTLDNYKDSQPLRRKSQRSSAQKGMRLCLEIERQQYYGLGAGETAAKKTERRRPRMPDGTEQNSSYFRKPISPFCKYEYNRLADGY